MPAFNSSVHRIDMEAGALAALDFVQGARRPTHGLVPVADESSPLRVDEHAVLLDARLFERVDYVFFRRFEDGRSSQVAAFVVDNSNESLDEAAIAKLHHDLWLHGVSPLLYVSWPTRIDIFSCARGPDFWHHGQTRYRPADRIESALWTSKSISSLLAAKRRRYSAFRLADGTFWEDPSNRGLARHANGAHQRLIEAVVEADQELDGANFPVFRRLLVLMVLVKYLEDRRVFPENWFDQFAPGSKSFFDVLRSCDPRGVKRLLQRLEERFDGDVFALPTNGPLQLTQKSLRTFAQLVEARTLNTQRYLWQQYSFEHLPVEVISGLYQRFVEGGHGAVYTPPILAALLLDEVMQYARLSDEERILDPACGSGVFLVGAFKRLVNRWRSKRNWRRPSVNTLKRILRTSIFGIELDPSAVDLTAFSLALAVCDALKPKVIWNELRFDALKGQNLLHGDFFALVNSKDSAWPRKFSVIVGNPPFESKLTPAGASLENRLKDKRGNLPDKQVAHLFLEQSIHTLAKSGRVCLIQPSGLLYNRNTESFRQRVFADSHVETVLDFTSVRNMYDVADPKTIAIVARTTIEPSDDDIVHLTFRRTFSTHQKIGFELDHYDRHRVSQQIVADNPFVWRANLLGGGRLVELSARLARMSTLSEFVAKMQWNYGEGFIAANSGRRQRAPFLTGKPYLPTKAFSTAGIDEGLIGRVKATHFRSSYTPGRYSPPLVLIKENESLPIAFWEKGFLAYRDKIVGISTQSSEPSERAELKRFFDTFCSRHRLYQFCCALNGSQHLVGKATAILKQDIDLIPFPDDASELRLSFWEEILKEDVLKHMLEFVRQGQNSALLSDAARPKHVVDYAKVFCRLLTSVYSNLRSSDAMFLNGLICQPFYFGTSPPLTAIAEMCDEYLASLIYDESHSSFRTIRLVRYYADNVLLIVKPDRLRYWLRSTAIRDADETILDLKTQGY